MHSHHDTIVDCFGALWLITEARPTRYGFDVLIGRPMPRSRGAASTILTSDLVSLLKRHADLGGARLAGDLELPVSATTLKAIRGKLGLHYYVDRATFWAAHASEIAKLRPGEIKVFAERHGVTLRTVTSQQAKILGRRQPNTGWWRKPKIVAELMSGAPVDYIAGRLGLRPSSIRRMQCVLRKEGFVQKKL